MSEITREELEKARRKAARREWFDQKKNDLERWYREHKELVIPVATAAIIQGGRIVIKAMQTSASNRAIDYKDNHVYDPRSGCYIEVRHKLSGGEQVRLDALRSEGYSVTQALDEMGLIR